MPAEEKLVAFVRGYLECALWSSVDDDDGMPLDRDYSIEDVSFESLVRIIPECADFIDAQADLLEQAGDDYSQHGDDFWLTRNGHGTGFWDRGYGDVGDQLTEACKPYGSSMLIVGNDGKIHVT